MRVVFGSGDRGGEGGDCEAAEFALDFEDCCFLFDGRGFVEGGRLGGLGVSEFWEGGEEGAGCAESHHDRGGGWWSSDQVVGLLLEMNGCRA